MKRLLLIICIALPILSNAQQTKYNVEILTPNNDSTLFGIQYGIFNVEDTSMISGDVVKENKFSFKSFKREFLLSIYSSEYKDTTILVKVEGKPKEYNIPPVLLGSNTLNQVNVVSFRPMFRKSVKGMEVNVANTPLEKLENAFDVLKASPKIISPDDIQLQVIGKGVPTIFVDKQEISSTDELKAMPAEMIDKIEIITNPSAKYAAEGSSAVIEIYTKGFHLEGMRTTIGVNGGVNTQGLPSAGGRLGINAKKKKFSFNLNFSGSMTRSRTINSSELSFFDGSNIRRFEGQGNRFNSWFYGNAKMKYDFNKKHSLTFSTRGWGGGNRSKSSNKGITTQFDTLVMRTENHSNSKYQWGNISAGLRYRWKTDTVGSYFTARIGYRKKLNGNEVENDRSTINLNPYLVERFNRRTKFKDRPDAGTAEVNYTHIFDTTGWELSTGLTYSMLFNGTNFDQFNKVDNDWIRDITFSNSYDYTEQIGGVFIEVEKEWESFGFNLGLRGESTFIKGVSNSLNKKFIDTAYFNLFPSLTTMFYFENDMELYMFYSAEFDRPRFANYDPFIRQVDSFSIDYGNPLLVPEYGHEVGVEWGIWEGLELDVYYSYFNRPIADFSFVDANGIINTTSKNAWRTQELSVSLNWPTRLGFWSGYHSVWFDYSKTEFTADFNRSPFFGIGFGVYLYEHFDLPKKFFINTTLNINQSTSNGSQQTKPTYRWNIGVGKKLLKGDMTIQLRVNNIVPNKWRANNTGANYRTSTFWQGQFTTFDFSLSYKFGRLKAVSNIQDVSGTGQGGRL